MKSLLLLFAFILTAQFCGRVEASAVPSSRPLSQTIAQSGLIVVARLVSYTSDPTDQLPIASKSPSGQMFYMGTDAFDIVNYLKSRGQYNFEVIQTLKGQSEKTLQMKFPRLLAYYYGGARLGVEAGDKVLLLLKRDAQNQLVPSDPTLPLIPLAANVPIADAPVAAESETVASIQSGVLSLMLFGLTDPTLRQANTYLVRKTVAPQVVTGLAPYLNLNDANTKVEDYVLYGLATNQQVAVIPAIAALQRELGIDSGPMAQTARSLEMLQHFNTPKALPYLNPLLFQEARIIRISAMLGLPNLADRTSIPYLLLALHDPDAQKFIGPTATQLLHKLIPEFEAHQTQTTPPNSNQENAQFIAWWQDELAGKHPIAQDDSPAITFQPQQKFTAADLPQLNQGLFMLSETTRRAAARGLEQFADPSSIPYLLLALYDPQPDVAFSAYTTLHRLVPALGAAVARAKWQIERDTQTKLAFDWWQQHLIDADKPPTPPNVSAPTIR